MYKHEAVGESWWVVVLHLFLLDRDNSIGFQKVVAHYSHNHVHHYG
jgi:hypothetical protein